MQRFINITSILIVVLCSGTAFIYYHDDMDIKIPYLEEIFFGLAMTLIIFFLIKSMSRWQALFLGMRSEGFRISPVGFKKIFVYEGIMLLYYGVFGYLMLKYIDVAWWLGIAGLLFFVEGVAQLVLNMVAKPYKVLVNEGSITLIANELQVIFWSDVQKIDSRQNDIHIVNKQGNILLIDLEWFTDADRNAVIEKINRIAQEKRIYCSIDCKGVYKDFTKLAMQRTFEE